ncbi:unnamed protein product [Brachionus calyciflorus]|uniref:ISXO2-like transposase domain-containing protein n=1 Tax=Brachionus calyciflorus TaxID=104777 RepID=A0A814J5F6_9BILA|nr:unnamed protein product [Brachionus calyciflorus]
MIKKYIKPQTTIISDCWSSYQYLQKAEFEHLTINHTIEFKNPETGAHTNIIEGTWFHLKRSLPRHGVLAGYFAEFIWRKKFGDFNDIINIISELFPAGEVDEFDIEGTNPDEYEKYILIA